MKKEVQFLGFVIALVVIIVMFFIGKVGAMDTPKITRQISIAKKELIIAENELLSKDLTAFIRYKQNPFSEEGHQAELELREKYPEEYRKYIEAKTKLDDLLYVQFMVFANRLPEGDK